MNAFAQLVDAIHNMEARRQRLISWDTSFLERSFKQGSLQAVADVSALVKQRAAAEVVLGNRGPTAEEWIIVKGERFGVLQLQEFGPVHNLVLSANMEGISLESERFFEVGELLIAEPRGFAQRARGADPANRRVFVGKAALEGHHYVTAVFHVVRDLLEERIIGNVKRRDDDNLVAGKISILREDKIHAGIE